ncbi:MAG: serine/threonine protein kinase bacterial, partial [Halothiobacillaceae bacterium]
TNYYNVAAFDPDPGDTVTFSLKSAPSWVTLSEPARIRFEPTCGSYGYPCPWGWTTVIVTATDSRGASTDQIFIVNLTTATVTVPNVVGMSLTVAETTLVAQDLQGVQWLGTYDAQPAGTVLAQNAVAGAVVGRFDDIWLTVSKGPQPVVVPSVVTQSESMAADALRARGFVVQVIRQYSNTVPAGQVIAQNPPVGNEVPPGNATITVSLGSGLIVRLHSNYTTADQSIPLSVVAVDQEGGESPFSGATLSVTPAVLPYLGAVPNADSASILPGLDTRGTFRVTATDSGTGRSASAEFVVAPPVANGEVDPFAQLSTTLNEVSTLLREARQASLAGDDATMETRTRTAVLLWRSFDQTLLRLSAPATPELGFMPRVTDMAGFGVTQTPDDLLNYTSFKTVAEKLDALVMGLRQRDTSLVEINTLFAA